MTPVSGVDYYVLSVADYNTLAPYFSTFVSYFSATPVGGYYYSNDPRVETEIWDVMDVYPNMDIIQMRYVRSTQSWTGI